jgi:hypothetical protein
MPRRQRLLPGRQIGVELGQRLRDFSSIFVISSAMSLPSRKRAQLVDLAGFGDGLSKSR